MNCVWDIIHYTYKANIFLLAEKRSFLGECERKTHHSGVERNKLNIWLHLINMLSPNFFFRVPLGFCFLWQQTEKQTQNCPSRRNLPLFRWEKMSNLFIWIISKCLTFSYLFVFCFTGDVIHFFDNQNWWRRMKA